MVNFTIDQVRKIMDLPDQIRNMYVRTRTRTRTRATHAAAHPAHTQVRDCSR